MKNKEQQPTGADEGDNNKICGRGVGAPLTKAEMISVANQTAAGIHSGQVELMYRETMRQKLDQLMRLLNQHLASN